MSQEKAVALHRQMCVEGRWNLLLSYLGFTIHSSVPNNASNTSCQRKGQWHIDYKYTINCTHKEVQRELSYDLLHSKAHMLIHLFLICWVTSIQYHLIMMWSRIRFATRLVDGTSIWFSLVLALGAMSWKAIRSIKRSTGMVRAPRCAAACSKRTKRER